MDIHAQVIESLLAGEACNARTGRPWLELGVLLASGLLLIGFLPILRARYAGGGFVALAAMIWLEAIWRSWQDAICSMPLPDPAAQPSFISPCSATPWSPPMPGDAGPSGNCNRAGRKRHA